MGATRALLVHPYFRSVRALPHQSNQRDGSGCDSRSGWSAYHESALRIEEHYTDTFGFTDHVLALCHFLGFRFAPRFCDLAGKRLYVHGKPGQWPALSPLIGGSLNLKLIEQQFPELVRLAASIKQGTVTASLILRKLGSYPRQNSLALALRELGRMPGPGPCCLPLRLQSCYCPFGSWFDIQFGCF